MMEEPEQPKTLKVRSPMTWPEAVLALGALTILGTVIIVLTWLVLR